MNESVFLFFHNFAHQSDILDKVVTFIAEPFSIMILMVGGLFILFHHEVFTADSPYEVLKTKKRELLAVVLSVGLAYLASYALKLLFAVPRPFEAIPFIISVFEETGYAFPSSHAAVFSALAFAIYFMHKRVGYIFMGVALLIGLARIVAGVHYPVDILGGFALGALVAYLVRKI